MGFAVGFAEGFAVGFAEGLAVGFAEGLAVGFAEGLAVGPPDGPAVGLAVGPAEGLAVGLPEGLAVGPAVGLSVGLAVLAVGLTVGLSVGSDVRSSTGGLVGSGSSVRPSSGSQIETVVVRKEERYKGVVRRAESKIAIIWSRTQIILILTALSRQLSRIEQKVAAFIVDDVVNEPFISLWGRIINGRCIFFIVRSPNGSKDTRLTQAWCCGRHGKPQNG